MIDLDVSKALKQVGNIFSFKYVGMPDISGLEFCKPLEINAEYSLTGNDIRIVGSFEATVSAECTRCLSCIEYVTNCKFDEIFEKAEVADGQVEIEDGNGNYRFFAAMLSLDKLVYDAIVLDIPQQIFCSDDCKGLCQCCGKNLNESECGCSLENGIDITSPFYKLKDLFDDNGDA